MSNPFDTTLAKGGFAMRVSVESWHCLISRIALELDHSIDCLSWCMLPLHDNLDGYLVNYSVRFEEEDVDSRNRLKVVMNSSQGQLILLAQVPSCG